MKTAIMGLALTGTALAGGQAIAQAIPKTTPENLAPAPLKVPLPTPTPSATPVPSATPATEQPLVVVPVEPSNAPQAPPRARSAPRETPVAAPARGRPTPSPTTRATRTPREVAPPGVAPTPTPAVTPMPSAAPSAEPSPVATPVVVPMAQPEAGAAWPDWLVPALVAGLIALLAGFAVWRRRGVEEAEEIAIAPVEPAPSEPAASPAAPAPVPNAPQFLERPAPRERAWLDLGAPAVHRAGINLVTATADVALVVRNEGNGAARDIRLAIRLTSAQPGQDAVLDALFSEPVERPVVPPFDLAPGEERAVRGIATLPRDAIVALTAAGRPMFVPVVALNLLYDAGAGTPGQTTAAFAIGVERPGGGKLGPLWLDEPARMHDAIGIRAHGTTVKR